MAKHKFLKTVLTLSALGAASKVAFDKYKDVKSKFEQEESESLSFEIKNYNAIFQHKVVEVDDEEFTGCEVKSIGSRTVIDLGLAVFEKDVYVDFTSVASSVTIVLPEGVNAACDVDKRVSVVTNLVQNTDEEGIHTVYVIGKAYASKIEVVPVDFYVDSEDDFEDFVDEDAEDNSTNNEDKSDIKAEAEKVAEEAKSDIKEEAKKAEDTVTEEIKSEAEAVKKPRGRKKAVSKESENDDLENFEIPEDEEDLRKIDGAIELTVEEVEKK
jgi:hypothetical protein